MTRKIATRTMEINQSAFIRDLVIEESLTNYNANVILMKAESAIKMSKPNNYDKTNIYTYQQLISKLMYLAYRTKLDIAFAVRKLSRHNANPKKGYLQAAKKVVRYLKKTI